jgi:hypothetical protein
MRYNEIKRNTHTTHTATTTTTHPQPGWERYRSCRTHCPNGMRRFETFSWSCSRRRFRSSNEKKRFSSFGPTLTSSKVSFLTVASHLPFLSDGAPFASLANMNVNVYIKNVNLERSELRVSLQSHKT